MRGARWCLPAVMVIAGVLIPQPLRAQNSTGAGGVTEAVDFVSKLPALFRSWVDQFDRIAESEQRRQFVRKVDRLRKGLYKLEVDKEFLLESIPDRDPDVALIHQNVADLEATLTALRETLREIGADVRAERGAEVEAILRSSLSTRTKGLAEVADAVQRADYDPVPIREALLRSLTAVRDAQVAVTDFYERLNASP
jgi:septal ring factor EnvC (AmiA/AmiB activator)